MVNTQINLLDLLFQDLQILQLSFFVSFKDLVFEKKQKEKLLEQKTFKNFLRNQKLTLLILV